MKKIVSILAIIVFFVGAISSGDSLAQKKTSKRSKISKIVKKEKIKKRSRKIAKKKRSKRQKRAKRRTRSTRKPAFLGSFSGGGGDKRPIRVRGQTRMLNMSLILKSKKDKIRFVDIRQNYRKEILETRY